MNIDEIKISWAKDCIIPDDLGHAAVTTPMLHAKYIDELITAKLKLTKVQHELASLKAIKSKYFRGEMASDELKALGWEQWPYRTLRAEVDPLIDADADYQKIVARESYMKAMLYLLESIMGEIKNRNWAIRGAIDWAKFRAGG